MKGNLLLNHGVNVDAKDDGGLSDCVVDGLSEITDYNVIISCII